MYHPADNTAPIKTMRDEGAITSPTGNFGNNNLVLSVSGSVKFLSFLLWMIVIFSMKQVGNLTSQMLYQDVIELAVPACFHTLNSEGKRSMMSLADISATSYVRSSCPRTFTNRVSVPGFFLV